MNASCSEVEAAQIHQFDFFPYDHLLKLFRHHQPLAVSSCHDLTRQIKT